MDGTGFYAFIDLPPGSYTVTASKSGYPNASATVNVAVGAVTGNMYEQNFVLGANIPPSITTQPQGQSVSQGANATFTVAATGTTPLSYQWRLYGTNIAGATASSYTRTTCNRPMPGRIRWSSPTRWQRHQLQRHADRVTT